MSLKERVFAAVEKFTEQKHINAIKDGMIAYVPFTIIAATVLLVAYFPSDQYIEFVTNVLGVSTPEVWQNELATIMNGTMNLASLISVIFISYNLSKEYKELDPILSAVLSFCIYMFMVPTTVIDGAVMVNFGDFGAANLVVAIIFALVIPELYRALWNVKRLRINLSSSVPPAVSKAFTSLLPMAIIFLIFFVLRLSLAATGFGTIQGLITTIISEPMSALSTNIWGYLIAILISNTLWAFGIHGTAIVFSGVMAPFLLMMSDQNRLAVQAGEALPNIITNEYLGFIGGVGLYLCIACLFICKNKQTRMICKLALIPAIFGIHEPLVFGLPIMFNPILAIPYVLCHVIGAGLTYIVTGLGFVARLAGVGVPWTMPPGLYGFLATNGHLSGFIWQVILGVLYVVICIPFVKRFDNKMLKKEQQLEQIEGTK